MLKKTTYTLLFILLGTTPCHLQASSNSDPMVTIKMPLSTLFALLTSYYNSKNHPDVLSEIQVENNKKPDIQVLNTNINNRLPAKQGHNGLLFRKNIPLPSISTSTSPHPPVKYPSKHKVHLCRVCNQRFNTHGAMHEHTKKHHGLKPYRCQFCHRQFSKLTNWTQHVSFCQNNNNVQPMRSISPPRSITNETIKTQDSKSLKFTEFSDSDSDTNSVCSKYSDKTIEIKQEKPSDTYYFKSPSVPCTTSVDAPPKKHSPNNLPCLKQDRLLKSLLSKKNVKIHTRKKDNRFMPYTCTVCQLPCVSQRSLSRHIGKQHFQQRKYKCPICELGFKNKWILQSHNKRFHRIDDKL